MQYFLIYIIIINIIAFLLMGIDKLLAKKHKWRISEKNLFIAPLLGGSIGGILGMQIFRHKTKHREFQFGFPMILLAWIIVLSYVCLNLYQR